MQTAVEDASLATRRQVARAIYSMHLTAKRRRGLSGRPPRIMTRIGENIRLSVGRISTSSTLQVINLADIATQTRPSNWTMTANALIDARFILTIPPATTLTIPPALILTILGELVIDGTLANNGDLVNNGIITNNSNTILNNGVFTNNTITQNRGTVVNNNRGAINTYGVFNNVGTSSVLTNLGNLAAFPGYTFNNFGTFTNIGGTSNWATVPFTPVLVSAVSGIASITLTFTPPANGGFPISQYKYTLNNGTTYQVLGTDGIIRSLVNGQTYNIAIQAINSIGASPTSNYITATPSAPSDPPTSLVATAGNRSIGLTWVAPVYTGGTPIRDYRYTTDNGVSYISLNTTATVATITALSSNGAQLVNGTAYTVGIAAENQAGLGILAIANTVTPATTPDAPTNLLATGANQSIVLSWTAPASTGGPPITVYQYTTDNGTTFKTFVPTGTTATISTRSDNTPLVNGTSYSVAIRVFNSLYYSPLSNSSTTTPATVPSAPTLVSATGDNVSIVLLWTAPASTGGSNITGYEYTTNGGTSYRSLNTLGTTATITTTSAANPAPILVNGQSYTIAVRAINITGTSNNSNSLSSTPMTTPDPPTLTSAVGGRDNITLGWTPPVSNGGSAITDYEYTTDNGATFRSLGTSGNTAIITMVSYGTLPAAALVPLTTYTIKLRSVNSKGRSPTLSNSLTAVPLSVPGAPTVTAAIGDKNITFSYTAVSNGSPITGYEYSYTSGGTYIPVSPPSATSINITKDASGNDLVNGTSYTLYFRALNVLGTGTSTASTATPAGVPGAPTVSATVSDKNITFSCAAVANGSPITRYEYSYTSGGTYISLGASAINTINITKDASGNDLVNGTSYTLYFRAVNGIGTGNSTAATATPAGVPGAPTVSTSRGDKNITFTCTAVGNGSAITRYEYSYTSGGTYISLGASAINTITITRDASGNDLVNGTSYTLYFRAVNVVGTGTSTAATATPAAVPGAPTVSAVIGDKNITFSCAALANGSPITRYEYSYTSGGTYISLGASAINTINITKDASGNDLVNGTSYTLYFRAVNEVGTGNSTASTATPAGVPGAPTVSTTPGNRNITFTCTAVANGSPITRYEYSYTSGGTYISLGASAINTITITKDASGNDLVNGTSYTLYFRAVNVAGTGNSTASTASPSGVPSAPTLNSATGGANSIALVWTAPTFSGASAITDYTYSTNGGTTYKSLATAGTTATITTDSTNTSLVAGTSYTITIKAVNNIGSGAASNAISATPNAGPPGAPTGLAARPANRAFTLTWTAPTSNGGSPIVNYNYRTNSSATYRTLATAGTSATIYTDSDGVPLSNASVYTFRIVAVNGASLTGGESNVTPQQQATPVWELIIRILQADIGKSLRLQIEFSGKSLSIDYGDGSTPDRVSQIVNHTYTSAGTYTIRMEAIDGTTGATGFNGIFYNSDNSPVTIVSVTSWLDALTNLSSAFESQQSNFPVPPYLPPNVLNLQNMFRNATAFNQIISSWNTSTVTNMQRMFDGATSFNRNLSGWSLANGLNAANIFINAPLIAETTVNWPPFTLVKGGAPAGNRTYYRGYAAVPDPPTLVSARGAAVSIVLTWSAPSDGGSAITDYQYTTDTGATKTYKTLGTLGTTATITTLSSSTAPLVNGTSYTVSIVAVNIVGSSIASAPLTATPAAAPPDAPRLDELNTINRGFVLRWTPPSFTGGSPIANYNYTTDGGTTYRTLNTAGTSATIYTTSAGVNLVNNTNYTISIVAVNGASLTSAASNSLQQAPSAWWWFTIAVSTTPIRVELGFLSGQQIDLQWGDNTAQQRWLTAPTYTYAAAGTYTIRIRAEQGAGANSFNGVFYNNNTRVTIVSVESWLDGLTNLSSAFESQQSNFPVPPYLPLNMINPLNVCNLQNMFKNAVAFNQDISSWNTAGVTNMQGMFDGAIAFNRNLSGWSLADGLNAVDIFANGALIGYSSNYGNWPPFTLVKGGADPASNRTYYTAPPMVLTITVTADDTMPIRLLFGFNAGQSVSINWGDSSTPDTWNSATEGPNHNYSIGTYTITISGTANSFGGVLNNRPFGPLARPTIVSITTWLNSLTSFDSAFDAVRTNFTVPSYLPPNVTNLQNMFKNTPFNQNIGSWNTRTVTNMQGMFNGAIAFNQPINSWNTTNVTNMGSMFSGATAFNQPINSWTTNNVTNMSGMFKGASALTQDVTISTAAAQDMSSMFEDATNFNGIPPAPSTATRNMSKMFMGAVKFNRGEINFWSTGLVTNMNSMFEGAIVFDAPIGTGVPGANTWNTTSVTDMRNMFKGTTAFNHNLSTWVLANGLLAQSIFANSNMAARTGQWPAFTTSQGGAPATNTAYYTT